MDKSEIETEVNNTLARSGFELVDLKMASHNGKPLLQIFVDRKSAGEPGRLRGPERESGRVPGCQ